MAGRLELRPERIIEINLRPRRRQAVGNGEIVELQRGAGHTEPIEGQDAREVCTCDPIAAFDERGGNPVLGGPAVLPVCTMARISWSVNAISCFAAQNVSSGSRSANAVIGSLVVHVSGSKVVAAKRPYLGEAGLLLPHPCGRTTPAPRMFRRV